VIPLIFKTPRTRTAPSNSRLNIYSTLEESGKNIYPIIVFITKNLNNYFSFQIIERQFFFVAKSSKFGRKNVHENIRFQIVH